MTPAQIIIAAPAVVMAWLVGVPVICRLIQIGGTALGGL